MTDLLRLLNRPDDAKLVVLVADGLGSSNAANSGVYSVLRQGLATSAGLQVPCPWARGAARGYQGEDVGVSLTVNAEHEDYRWGPITQAPSLLGGDGGFPREQDDLWDHADVDEVRRECRAQIERAVIWGFDISHLSAHLDALCARPEFFDVYLEMAEEFNLPISLPDPSVDLGFPARDLAREEGILVPDHVVAVPRPRESRDAIVKALVNLEPGVTELHVAPAADTPEIHSITPNWASRVSDGHLLTHDWGFRAEVARSGAELIGYRLIREAQRTHRPSAT